MKKINKLISKKNKHQNHNAVQIFLFNKFSVDGNTRRSSNMEMRTVLHRKNIIKQEINNSCITNLMSRADFRVETNA